MTTSRLDNVLRRNRNNSIIDLVLVAFLLVAVLFTGIAFGEELPNLSSTPVAASQEAAQVNTTVALADPPAPVHVVRR